MQHSTFLKVAYLTVPAIEQQVVDTNAGEQLSQAAADV
jgi:hypothetical protein